jgi:uncharacterized protein (TIGR03437 family)
MTHASLCKKTYKRVQWFLPIRIGRMDTMRSLGIAILLLLACAGMLSAQFSITTTTLPVATVGVAYSAQLQESGATSAVTWSISAGSLPPGLTLNASSGSITGTPASAGGFSFQAQAEFDSSAPDYASANLSIRVNSVCVPVFSPPSPLPSGDIGLIYPQIQFTQAGCPTSYTYSEQPAGQFSPTPLPPGLTLNSGGILSGTPTGVGTFSFLLTATDPNNQVTQVPYSITFNNLPAISTGSPLPKGLVGVPYSQQIAAKGGVPPYVFHMDAQPPGIVNITSAGVFYGTPTQAGTFNFNIGVSDSLGGGTTTPFQVTFVPAVSQIQAAPLSLTFNANLEGNPPATQAIAVVPASGATPPVNFTVQIDGGQTGTAAPSWITVTPTSDLAPAGLVVSVDQGTMPAGNYAARIQVLDSEGFANDISVTLNVASAPVQLTVAPTILNFAARSAAPGNLTEELVLSNSGAGSLGFTTSVVGNSSWISNVTSSSSTTARNAPVFVQVQVNTNGLQEGAYEDAIQLSSSAENIQIPVSLFVAASGSILGVDTTGVLFQAVEGGGSTLTQTVQILNLGDPSSTVNWNATLVSGSNWLSLVSSSGTATGTNPGSLTLALASNATQLTAGPYYAVIKITDSKSLNSPQYVTAVLNLEPSTAAAGPYLSPVGLFFATAAGGSAPTPQQVQVNTSSASGVTFNASVSTSDGGTWLSVAPASGNASGQSAGSIAVSVDATGLAAGIYSGDVNVSIGGLLQSVNVTFVVEPSSSSNASSSSIGRFRPEAAGCAASKLAITETGLANNFTVPAGWPATLIVQLNDDCSAPVTNGNVVASFSNGDPPLNLVGDSLGNYSSTWQAGSVNATMVVVLNATAGTLQPATAKLYGGIAPNQTPPPTIAPGGTLNNLNPVLGAPLAPGTIAQVYGSGLSASTVAPSVVPLRTSINNTFALVGPVQAPLYFLSSGQINLQIPNEATATQQLPIVLSVNNALTLPQMLNIVPGAPGVLSLDDGPTKPYIQNGAHIVAQHSSDFSLVSSSNPAKPGEYLIMYLVGMGATNPSVPSGAETPYPPLHNATVQPTVTVGSQPATVAFAGLSPYFVGLYQINFQVPTGAASGELEVDVKQNGVSANPTLLPVSN